MYAVRVHRALMTVPTRALDSGLRESELREHFVHAAVFGVLVRFSVLLHSSDQEDFQVGQDGGEEAQPSEEGGEQGQKGQQVREGGHAGGCFCPILPWVLVRTFVCPAPQTSSPQPVHIPVALCGLTCCLANAPPFEPMAHCFLPLSAPLTD